MNVVSIFLSNMGTKSGVVKAKPVRSGTFRDGHTTGSKCRSDHVNIVHRIYIEKCDRWGE